MNLDLALIAVLGALATLSNRLVAALFSPLFERFDWPKLPLMYIAWVVAGLLAWAFNLNVFEGLVANPVVGIVLTAICAGGGANLFHDLTDRGTVIIDVMPDTEVVTE